MKKKEYKIQKRAKWKCSNQKHTKDERKSQWMSSRAEWRGHKEGPLNF